MERNLPLECACKSFEEDLVLYYYGEMNDTERGRVERHLSNCAACGRFIGDLRRLLPQMANSEAFAPSFWDSYYRQTMAKLARREQKESWWRDLLAPARVWMLPAFGTAAVAVLAIALVFNKGDSQRFSDRSMGAIPQEILADANQLEFFKTMDMLEALSKLEEQVDQNPEPKPERSSRLDGMQANA